MTFQTLVWLFTAVFFLLAANWFLVLERERRSPERLSKDERTRKELQKNVERVRGLIR